ncbi:unnamed protein product [Closterium sp. Naga37s-1]|nr:unnamed protein product [Closterium sp. Naga37s-1]
MEPEHEKGLVQQKAPPDDERDRRRRCASCLGSERPSPHASRSLPLVADPPSSQADRTPHHPRDREDPTSHHDRHDSLATDPTADSAEENCAGAARTHDPDEVLENGGEIGGGPVRVDETAAPAAPAELQAAQRGQPGPLLGAQPTVPGRQWWRMPPAGTRQVQKSAARGRQQVVQRERAPGVQRQTLSGLQGEPGEQLAQPGRTAQQQRGPQTARQWLPTNQARPQQGEPRAAMRSGDGSGGPAITIAGSRSTGRKETGG